MATSKIILVLILGGIALLVYCALWYSAMIGDWEEEDQDKVGHT